jgi:hypothetical protein
MPRAKTTKPTFGQSFQFKDGQAHSETIGESVARRLEQALKLHQMAIECGDSLGIEAAKTMRQTVVAEVNQWASAYATPKVQGQAAAEHKKTLRRSKLIESTKGELAAKAIAELIAKGMEHKAIPGIIERRGVCSARYARDLLKKMHTA